MYFRLKMSFPRENLHSQATENHSILGQGWLLQAKYKKKVGSGNLVFAISFLGSGVCFFTWGIPGARNIKSSNRLPFRKVKNTSYGGDCFVSRAGLLSSAALSSDITAASSPTPRQEAEKSLCQRWSRR